MVVYVSAEIRIEDFPKTILERYRRANPFGGIKNCEEKTALSWATILFVVTGENCNIEKRQVSRLPFPLLSSLDQKPPPLHAHRTTQPLIHPMRLNHEDGENMFLRSAHENLHGVTAQKTTAV
jgi:hypothetical protein